MVVAGGWYEMVSKVGVHHLLKQAQLLQWKYAMCAHPQLAKQVLLVRCWQQEA